MFSLINLQPGQPGPPGHSCVDFLDMRFKHAKSFLIISIFVIVILLMKQQRPLSSQHSSDNNITPSSNGKGSTWKGGIVFGTLQICKDHKVFKERVMKIEKTDKHLAEYLRKTRPLSVKFAHLTEMGDPQAMALPVIKTNSTTKTDTVIYNRINKCGSSTLLSMCFLF